jgi:hypothetical protein
VLLTAPDLIIRGVDMRRTTLFLLLLAFPAMAGAQDRRGESRRQGLPRDVQREATSLYNSASKQVVGRLDVDENEEIRGDVAVRNGPVVIAGRIRGSLLAINADVILRPTARIERDLLVVGGEVEGRSDAYVGGEIRIYRQSLRYAETGDRIVAERDTSPDDDGWWRRFERRRPRSWSKIQIASAGAYNRVEGLPINLGPQIHQVFPWGSMRIDAYGVVRTGSSFASEDSNDVGHNARLELRFGQREGIGFGGRLFNIVDGVEPWQLGDLESSLASFLFRRDYRDYYQRHGGSGYATLYLGRDISLTGALSHERWTSREMNNPFTLFRGGNGWRPNPLLDDGIMHVANGTLKIDTRNDEDHPWSGWYIAADFERGTGTLSSLGMTSQPRVVPAGPIAYSRGFLDFRRYNRLSPGAQINLRILAGGWLDGDRLPLQRRFSVEGAGMLPGYDFRSPREGDDVGTCSAGPFVPLGRPAECERMALAQIEYRGDLHFDLFNFGEDDDDEPDYRSGFRADGTWVLFADAGRGWLVGTPVEESTLTYESNELPPLSSFRTDVGIGLDFGAFGVYVAKALSTPKEPANVFVRLKHRF